MYKNIVIPVDLSKGYAWPNIISVSLNFVSAFRSKLHFVNIIPDLGVSLIADYLPNHWMSNQKEQNKKMLEGLIESYIPREVKVESYVGHGVVYEEIIRYVASVNSDLIIVPTIKDHLDQHNLGGNATKLIKFSTVSVLVVRD